MNGFLEINRIFLPYSCLAAAYGLMRKAGIQRVEAVALFAGIEHGNVFQIKKTIIPRQQAFSSEDGLLYSVGSDELHRINVWLYEHKMSLIAQIHSHPASAYHSGTDDTYPIVATLGGISIVVPDFASGPIDLDTCAVYRLFPEEGWVGLQTQERKQLIEVIK